LNTFLSLTDPLKFCSFCHGTGTFIFYYVLGKGITVLPKMSYDNNPQVACIEIPVIRVHFIGYETE
tara:strand:- start:1457 stop:1654 length:198 start_codon:yes stop_codon:yes gene_type:complete